MQVFKAARFLSTSIQDKFKTSLEKQQSLSHLCQSILSHPPQYFTPQLCATAFTRVGEICHEYNRPPPDVKVLHKLVQCTTRVQHEFSHAQDVSKVIRGLARSGWIIGKEMDPLLESLVDSKSLRKFSHEELIDMMSAVAELKTIAPNELLQFRIAQAIKDKPTLDGLSLQSLSLLLYTFQRDEKMQMRIEHELLRRKEDLVKLTPSELFQIINLLMESDIPVQTLHEIELCLSAQQLDKVDLAMLFLVLAQIDRLQLAGAYPQLTRAILREMALRGAPMFLGGFANSKRYLRTLQRIRMCRDANGKSVLQGENLLHPNFSRVGVIVGLSTYYVLFILDGGILGLF